MNLRNCEQNNHQLDMKPIIKTYSVKVIREAGTDPLSGQFYSYAEQEMNIDAISLRSAYQISLLSCSIQFSGQIRRTFIDKEEYFSEKI